MGDPISVLIWGVMPYIMKSNYSYHPSLGLDKFPGGVFTSYFTNLQFYNCYLQFTINIL